MATITKSIGTTGRDYSTITAWEADLDNGAVYAAADDAVGECYNDSAFDEAVTIDGGGTIGLNSRRLSVASSDRHDGTAGTGARIVRTAAGGIGLNIVGTVVEWLEINANGTKSGFSQAGISNTLYVQIGRQLICHGFNTADGGSAAFSGANDRQSTWVNCIAYDVHINSNSTGSISGFGGFDDKASRFNCTAHNITDTVNHVGAVYGFDQGTTTNPTCKNCLATSVVTLGSGGALCFSDASTANDHNASSDATASGTGSLTNITAADQYVSTTVGSEDLHLKTGADAIDAGVDLATTPAGVNIDIDGRDRDAEGDTWDIGADEFVSIASGSSPPRRHNWNFWSAS